MQEHHFLTQALVYLAAASLFVPLFKRIGLGSVLGYLVAGVAIGSWGLGLITDQDAVREVSELGVVLLLFLVGLELNPERLWSLRRAIFGLGSLQVLVTIGLVSLALMPMGMHWSAAVAFGMAAAMSSTAIALQILAERNVLKAAPGQSAFAVSLFQDLAVIPILLGLSLLGPAAGGAGGVESSIAGGAGGAASAAFSWFTLAKAAALIAVMVIGGRYLLRPLLHLIALTRMREIFIAFALLLIVGSAVLTQSIGLSMALGSFIAGVLLADSDYRMELEVDIEPFKGLLLGLFFIAVGMSIDIGLILASPWKILGLALAIVLLKLLILGSLGALFRLCREDGWLFALSLSQVGEFAFVLITQAQADRVLSPVQAATANAVIAVSMLTTPLLFLIFDRWLAPHYRNKSNRAPDIIDVRNRVIIAGMGRFGQIIARLLMGRKYGITIIDHNAVQVETMGRFGYRGYYGDVSRPDVLEAAGIDEASLLVLAIDDPEAIQQTVAHVQREYPKVTILARARSRTDALELRRAKVPAIRETFASALEVAELSLVALGDTPEAARRAAVQFRAQDERQFNAQLLVGEDEDKLIAIATKGRRELIQLLENESDQPAGAFSSINPSAAPSAVPSAIPSAIPPTIQPSEHKT